MATTAATNEDDCAGSDAGRVQCSDLCACGGNRAHGVRGSAVCKVRAFGVAGAFPSIDREGAARHHMQGSAEAHCECARRRVRALAPSRVQPRQSPMLSWSVVTGVALVGRGRAVENHAWGVEGRPRSCREDGRRFEEGPPRDVRADHRGRRGSLWRRTARSCTGACRHELAGFD